MSFFGKIILALGALTTFMTAGFSGHKNAITTPAVISTSAMAVATGAPAIILPTSTATMTPLRQSFATSSASNSATIKIKTPVQVSPLSVSALADTPTTSTSGPSISNGPMTEQLVDQKALADATVAVICVGPAPVVSATDTIPVNNAIQFYTLGSGVVVNPNGYLLTNAHVIQDTRQCFLGRQYVDATGNFHTNVAAVYNFLNVVGVGNWQSIENVADPTADQIAASAHDFAVLKIGDRYTPALWDEDSYQLNSLNIPVASDADYAKYFVNGKFPAIGVNFSYRPTIGDLLFSDGYIGDTGRSRFVFTQGDVSAVTSENIGTEMSSGQGDSGSPLVDANGNLVGLVYLLNCGIVGGGGCNEDQPNSSMSEGYYYGSYNLALSVPFLDQAMKQDLGFSLHDLVTMQ